LTVTAGRAALGDNDEWAAEIIAFIDGGCDLSAYKDGPRLTVIKGGKETRDAS